MAYLVNRVAPSRMQCLQVLCRMINHRYGVTNAFTMNDVKYNPPTSNIKSFCYRLRTNQNLSISYCPYKRNPLDSSGCFITNGLIVDTTKSKEISNTINALDALGYVQRSDDNSIMLTSEGKLFAETDYYSNEMLSIIRNASLRYGVMVGFLGRILTSGKTTFKTTDFAVGYPSPEEIVSVNSTRIRISCGSEADSNTRTRSCLLAWAIASGIVWPSSLMNLYSVTEPHVGCLDYINGDTRSLRDYNVLSDYNDVFPADFTTLKPLDYNNLTKNVGALREHNQRAVRETTMLFEPKIKNRRLAVIIALQKSRDNNELLDPNRLIDYLLQYPELFVVNQSSFISTMMLELEIAFSVGLPYTIESGGLRPLVGVNLSELVKNAPESVLNSLLGF